MLNLNEAACPTCFLILNLCWAPGAYPQPKRGWKARLPDLFAYPQPVWAARCLSSTQTRLEGLPARPACLSSTCVGRQVLILNLYGWKARLSDLFAYPQPVRGARCLS